LQYIILVFLAGARRRTNRRGKPGSAKQATAIIQAGPSSASWKRKQSARTKMASFNWHKLLYKANFGRYPYQKTVLFQKKGLEWADSSLWTLLDASQRARSDEASS
jgi:hypothetical protein